MRDPLKVCGGPGGVQRVFASRIGSEIPRYADSITANELRCLRLLLRYASARFVLFVILRTAVIVSVQSPLVS
jgi:hypothetical protein